VNNRELVERWKKTGLIDDLVFEDQAVLAKRLDEAVYCLLHVDDYNDDSQFAILCIPTIAKLYRMNDSVLIKMKVLYDLYIELKDNFDEKFIDDNPDYGYDFEAELVLEMCNEYITRKLYD
jgi:hypothetical protein